MNKKKSVAAIDETELCSTENVLCDGQLIVPEDRTEPADVDDLNKNIGETDTKLPEVVTKSNEDRPFPRPPVAVCEKDNGYRCSDGKTIVGAMQLCDGKADCLDGADEEKCKSECFKECSALMCVLQHARRHSRVRRPMVS